MCLGRCSLERERISIEQHGYGKAAANGHQEFRTSWSGSDDVGASLARKATFERIQSCGAIACLRSENEEVAVSAGRAALDGGISVLEVTMRTPGASQVIKKLGHEYPSATIGAGTVLTWQDGEIAKEAGATFLMSPVTDQELIQVHTSSTVLFIPGAMTPSEILQARRWGASCVKLYPVSLMGGIQYVKMLKLLFPSLPIIPANGISLDAVESYLQVGSTAVVTSNAIFNKTALVQHDYDQIADRAKRVATVAANSERVDSSTLKYTRNGQRFRAVI
ncbi:hypothetical protein M758_2G233000 [Ceratodon purpureus]|nr:hypothetical protein M758_2G233000 [Ceratodon purpureus]